MCMQYNDEDIYKIFDRHTPLISQQSYLKKKYKTSMFLVKEFTSQ